MHHEMPSGFSDSFAIRSDNSILGDAHGGRPRMRRSEVRSCFIEQSPSINNPLDSVAPS